MVVDRFQELVEERRHQEVIRAMRDNRPSNSLETLGEWIFILGLGVVYVAACIVLIVIKYWWIVLLAAVIGIGIKKGLDKL
jgi:CHASE2 domain-containing sensor protein